MSANCRARTSVRKYRTKARCPGGETAETDAVVGAFFSTLGAPKSRAVRFGLCVGGAGVTVGGVARRTVPSGLARMFATEPIQAGEVATD